MEIEDYGWTINTYLDKSIFHLNLYNKKLLASVSNQTYYYMTLYYNSIAHFNISRDSIFYFPKKVVVFHPGFIDERYLNQTLIDMDFKGRLLSAS